MKYYLKPNENYLFLKNKKDILSFNVSAFIVDINFNYTTNRDNRKNKTNRIVYFNNNNCLKFFSLSTNKFNECIEDFFKEKYITFFNNKYPYRAIKDIKICSITLIETASLNFDKDGLFIDVKSYLDKKNISDYPNNLIFCESEIRYNQKNKSITKIIYSFDSNDNSFKHKFSKPNNHIKSDLKVDLNILTESFKEKGKKLFSVKENSKISNVKILDILKTTTLNFKFE